MLQTSSIPSPPLRSPDWFLNLLEEKLSYRCCDGCRQTELFVRGAKYKKGGAQVSLLLTAYKFAVFTQGSFFSCERGFKISLTCSSRFGRSKRSSRGPIVEWIILNTYIRFVTKWLAWLILVYCFTFPHCFGKILVKDWLLFFKLRVSATGRCKEVYGSRGPVT